MIFAIDPTMKRLVATIPRGDRIAEFDCVPDTCRNPACRCLTMTVTFRARTLDDPGSTSLVGTRDRGTSIPSFWARFLSDWRAVRAIH